MHKNAFKTGLLAVLLLACLSACKKKDEGVTLDNITTVLVHLTATDGSLNEEYEWNDLDGAGGNPPEIDNILLAAGKTYDCHLHVYDRTKTPQTDYTEDIEANNTDFLFVYTPTTVDVTITPTEDDDNGKPVRHDTQWVAGATSIGSVNIVLKQNPDKNAANPDVTGETKFDVSIPVRVQ